jgi:hypothetical protein
LGIIALGLTVLILTLVLGISRGQGQPDDPPGPASLDVSPRSLGFGTVEVGAKTSPQEVTLVSTDEEPVELDDITIDGPDKEEFGFDRKCSGMTLRTDQECTVSVTFTPAADRKYSARLVIDRADGDSETVQLSGTGVESGTAHATLSPPDMKAIAPVGKTVTLRFDFENTGTAPLTVYGVVLEDEHGYFTGNGGACSKDRLEPGTGCSIEVFFTPVSTVTSEGELLIKHGAPGGTSRARLEGVGTIEETTLPQSGTAPPDP